MKKNNQGMSTVLSILIVIMILTLIYINYMTCRSYTGGESDKGVFDYVLIPSKYCKYICRSSHVALF